VTSYRYLLYAVFLFSFGGNRSQSLGMVKSPLGKPPIIGKVTRIDERGQRKQRKQGINGIGGEYSRPLAIFWGYTTPLFPVLPRKYGGRGVSDRREKPTQAVSNVNFGLPSCGGPKFDPHRFAYIGSKWASADQPAAEAVRARFSALVCCCVADSRC